MLKISITSLYNWNNNIFDGLVDVLPSGVDNNVIINNILFQCAEYPFLYTDPDAAQAFIGYWAATRALAWEKLYNTTQFKYNPIWNKDGTITETRKLNETEKASGSTNGTGESINQVSAYDSSSFENREKSTGSNNSTTNGNSDRGLDESITRTEQGNIGVTMTQQLIEAERALWEFDVYNRIVQEFKNQFCLLLY